MTPPPTLEPTTVAVPDPTFTVAPEQTACDYLFLPSLTECRATSRVSWEGGASHYGTALPSEIRRLAQLEFLSFYDERLTGTVPSSFSNLTRLTLLDTSGDGLTGTVPETLCSQQVLIYVDCSELACSCYGSGDYPYKLCSGSEPPVVAATTAPNLSLTPEEIACNFLSLTSLTECQNTLEFDSFHGRNSTIGSTIPSEIGLLTQLRHLVFNHNQLTGSIPASLSNLNQLTTLDFSFNKLTWKIPSSLSSLSQLQLLDFSLNDLSGSIPSSCFHPHTAADWVGIHSQSVDWECSLVRFKPPVLVLFVILQQFIAWDDSVLRLLDCDPVDKLW